MTRNPPDPSEFKRAVVALRSSLDAALEVHEKWWIGTVEVRDTGSIRTYLMHSYETALDFCRRVCRSEPSCDPAVLEHFAAGRSA
jgi:hypothetical protein